MLEPGPPLSRFEAWLPASPVLRFVLLAVFYSGLIGLALACPWLVRHVDKADSTPATAWASVNGQTITPYDYFTALRANEGARVMNHCLEVTAILQAAQKVGLSLSSTDLSVLDGADHKSDEPWLRTYHQQEARAQLFLHKLLMRQVTEAQERHVYETFKKALTQYQVSALPTSSMAEAGHIADELTRGSSFDNLAAYLGRHDPSGGSRIKTGWMTEDDLAAAFGPVQARRVIHLKEGEWVRLHTQDAFYFIHLVGVRDSFADLKPSVDSVLMEKVRVKFLYDLMQEAAVVSPFGGPGQSSTVAPLPGNPKVRGTAAPLPGNPQVRGTAAPLPGNPEVQGSTAPLPGNPEVRETESPLPGNGRDKIASPQPANTRVPELPEPDHVKARVVQ